MRRMDGAQIMSLWKRIESDAGHWRNTWEEIAWHMHPAKVGFISEREPGERKTEYIFDSTGIQALDDLAHYLATALTPNAHTWARLGLKEGSDRVNVREWLESCGERMSAAWLASNFYKMAGESYKDIAGFGTMALEGWEKKDVYGRYDGLHFENVHMRECGGILNRFGNIDVTCRVYEKNAVSWFQEFGMAAGEKVLGAYITKPDTMVKMLHICYPRDPEDIDPDAMFLGPAEAKKLPYASAWVECSKAEIIRESGFYEPCRIIARWDINTDTIYGHGPGLKALPDVRTLNEAKRLELDWYEKNIDPPMKTTENNIVGDAMNVGAGALTTVRDMDALQELYQRRPSLQFSIVKTEELKSSIREIFYSDLIRDEGLTRRTGVSDFEVARRMERAQRILGEAVGGLRNEFLKWVVERTFSIMYRNGQFEDPPDLGDAELDVKYVSPLQTAQQAQGAESTALFLAELSQLAAVQRDLGRDPDALDRVDFDAMTKEMAEARNIPASVLRSDDEMQVIRTARQRARAEANAMAEAQQAASAARDLGAAVGEENVVEMITGG